MDTTKYKYFKEIEPGIYLVCDLNGDVWVGELHDLVKIGRVYDKSNRYLSLRTRTACVPVYGAEWTNKVSFNNAVEELHTHWLKEHE